MDIFLLLILSILPVVFFGYLIYERDFDKEPTSILVKLFICGIGSTFLTLVISGVMKWLIPFFENDNTTLNIYQLIPYVFIGIAAVEEFSKWIFVYKLEYNDNEFNHLYDGIVYAAFVALGFACFENILYVINFGNAGLENGLQVAISRAFLAIPGHLCDGIMMGYYLSMAKLALRNNNIKESRKNILLSLLIPTLAHFLYDYLIMAAEVSNYQTIFLCVFYFFIIGFFIYASKKVKSLSTNYYNLNPNYIGINQRKKMANIYSKHQVVTVNKQQNTCSNCGHIVKSKYCPECGKKNE